MRTSSSPESSTSPDNNPSTATSSPTGSSKPPHQATPVEPFPWSTNTSRRRDTDHPDPYRHDSTPAQTGLHNCARLARHLHRVKTHTPWRRIKPAADIYLWRSPHGSGFRIDHTGTHRTGENDVIELLPRSA